MGRPSLSTAKHFLEGVKEHLQAPKAPSGNVLAATGANEPQDQIDIKDKERGKPRTSQMSHEASSPVQHHQEESSGGLLDHRESSCEASAESSTKSRGHKPRSKLFTKVTNALASILPSASSSEEETSPRASEASTDLDPHTPENNKNITIDSSSSSAQQPAILRPSSPISEESGVSTPDPEVPLSVGQIRLQKFIQKRRANAPAKYPPPVEMPAPPSDKASPQYIAWLLGPSNLRPRFHDDAGLDSSSQMSDEGERIAEDGYFSPIRWDAEGRQYRFTKTFRDGRPVYEEVGVVARKRKRRPRSRRRKRRELSAVPRKNKASPLPAEQEGRGVAIGSLDARGRTRGS